MGVKWETADFICTNAECRHVTLGYGNYVSNLEKEKDKLCQQLASANEQHESAAFNARYFKAEYEKTAQQLTDALNENLRLQLVADDVRNTYAKALRDTEKELRQHLASYPIKAARQTGYMAGHASRDGEFVELRQQLENLTIQCQKVVKWKYLMSYNDSYFGEPNGDLKRAIYGIDRVMSAKRKEPESRLTDADD